MNEQTPNQTAADTAQLGRASVLLRAGGWLEIAYGAITLLSALLLIFMRDTMPAFLKTKDMAIALETMADMPGILTALAWIDVVLGIVIIWFGSVAIRHHRDREKITFLYVVGIVLLVLGVLGLSVGFTLTSVLGIAGGLCYFLGGLFKKKYYAVM